MPHTGWACVYLQSAAAKQAQRAAKELEEAIEAGMAKRKGRGKKLRAEKGEHNTWQQMTVAALVHCCSIVAELAKM